MCRLAIAGFLVAFSVLGCSSMKASDRDAAQSARPDAPAQAPAAAPEPDTASAPVVPAPPAPAAPSPPPTPVPAQASAPAQATAPTSPTSPAAPPPAKPPAHPAKQAGAAAPARPTVAQPSAAQTKPQTPPAQAAAAAAPPASSATPVPAATATAASSPPPQSLPTLDLHALEQRLRETRAIGVFAKLSLKNQVDDLLSAFRELYKVPNKRPPAELRQRYDLLLLKVLSLLQDADPPLASAIASSKEAIWSILADPDKFSKI